MDISRKDAKLLWSRAAGLCSICKAELTYDTSSINSSLLIGQQAHIVAEQPNGPRGKSILSVQERNSYHNLILLCSEHHIKIDNCVEDYPAEKLYLIKSRHELWVKENLSEAKKAEEEYEVITNLLFLVEELAT